MKYFKNLLYLIIAVLLMSLVLSCGTKSPNGPITGDSSPTPTRTPGGNDTWQDSAVIVSGAPLLMRFDYWNDEDWVSFVLTQESEIDLSITGFPDDGVSPGDCPYVDSYYGTPGTSLFSFGYDTSSINYQFLQPGTYYLHIRHANYDFEVFSFTLNLSVNPYPTATPTPSDVVAATDTQTATEISTITETPNGTFTITPTFSKTLTPSKTETLTITETPWAADAYEPDNASGAARQFIPGTELNHTLFPAGDEDWYTFTLSSPGDVTVSAQAAPIGWDMRMAVYYDYNLSAPIFTANGGFPDGICWFIHYFSAGKYYVRIYDADDSTPLGYDVYFGEVLSSPTVTPTATETHTNSPTGTATCFPDSYEPDGLPTQATTMTPGVTQFHSNYPENDADWLKFYVNYPSLYTITVNGNPDSTHNIYVKQDNTGTPGTGINGCTGCYGTVNVSGEAWTGLYWIEINSAYAFYQYSVSLTLITMTPSPTFTATPTVTNTHTHSPTKTQSATRTNTFTITQTRTITMTPTLTPGWTDMGSISCTGTPDIPVIANKGGTLVHAWLEDIGDTTEVLYVDGTALTNTATSLLMSRRWISCNSTDTYAAYNDNYYRTFVISSVNGWAGPLGSAPVFTNSIASAIYVDGTTPYVASVDQTAGANKITVKYFNGSNWLVYGAPAFSNKALAGYAISLKGYNDGTLHLYVAYQDNDNGNKLAVFAKHGSGPWAIYGGGFVSAGFASWHDLDVIDGTTPIVTYTDFTNSNYPKVKYSDGSAWADLGSAPPVAQYSFMPSIRASALNDVYLAYAFSNGDGYVYHYNGSSWNIHGDTYTLASAYYNLLEFAGGDMYVSWRDYTPPYTYVIKTRKTP